jgi:hypothetical protein
MTSEHTWQRQFTYQPPVSIWRQPGRLIAAIGCVAVIVGAFLPWASGVLPKAGPRQLDGFSAPGDGVFMIATAAAVLVMLAIRALAESKNPVGRILPIVLTVPMAVVCYQDYVQARAEVATWLSFSGTGSIGVGLWLIVAGIVAMGIGSTWLLIRGQLDPE